MIKFFTRDVLFDQKGKFAVMGPIYFKLKHCIFLNEFDSLKMTKVLFITKNTFQDTSVLCRRYFLMFVPVLCSNQHVLHTN